jgi:hypothetical protein
LEKSSGGREYDKILFRNGYARNALEMLVEFRGCADMEEGAAHGMPFGLVVF